MDGGSAQTELVSVWAEYCNANGIQTPLSPPGYEDEEPAEPSRSKPCAKRKISESSEQQTQTKRRRDEDEEEKVVKKI